MSLLEVSGVSVAFGGRLALDDVSLRAEPGEITGLIGPNGAGKTTLFNVICGLQRSEAGSIRIGDADLTRLAPFRRARRGLARTFQRLELFGLLTVKENVRLAARVARAPDPLDRAAGLIQRLGLNDVIDVRADRLPTGRARLVELARALATEPKVLLLDEPASGQSDIETATFTEVLRSLSADGLAVVLVEHDVPLVMEVCSKVYVLDLGRILAHGAPADVRADDAVVAAYLGQMA